jgi:hypothetical protein
MKPRSGEKLGWLLGRSGGFIWVLILAVVVWTQGEALQAALGLVVFSTAVASILALAHGDNLDSATVVS